MIFNGDLLDTIAYTQIGLTIPSTLLDSPIYKYVMGSSKYQAQDMTPRNFASIAINDKDFVDEVCTSKRMSAWAYGVIASYLYLPKKAIAKRCIGMDRIVLAMDNREILKHYVAVVGCCISNVVLYSYATIEQLEWIWTISVSCRFIDEEFVCMEVGRLDVMQFINSKMPEVFDDINSTTELYYFLYINEHIPRELAALEWLFNRINLQYDASEIHVVCQLPYNNECHDNSIMQWLLKHRSEQMKAPIRTRNHYNEAFMFIFQYLSKETMAMFVEKISSEPLIRHIGKEMMSKIDYLHDVNLAQK